VYVKLRCLCCLTYLLIHGADPEDPYKVTENTRKLGLVVCRGLQVSLLCPSDGIEEIANPFEEAAEEGMEDTGAN
jgi:hypothetical protein